MPLNRTSLSKDDIRAIIAHLEECAEVLAQHRGAVSAREIAFKSALGALLRELNEELGSKARADD
ncbi:MAG TPA: hypothetical protein VN775_12305 [Opitutaceae bacterium]|nr:hypothetical protein [Opitutaceae bacterium]